MNEHGGGIDRRTVFAVTNGNGTSVALSAELNMYPGPRHVLDLVDVKGLDAEQIARVEAIRAKRRGRE